MCFTARGNGVVYTRGDLSGSACLPWLTENQGSYLLLVEIDMSRSVTLFHLAEISFDGEPSEMDRGP